MTKINRTKVVEFREPKDLSKRRIQPRIDDDFHLLFNVLFAAGLTFPPIFSKRRSVHFLRKLFEIILNTMALVVILVNILFWQRRYSSVTLHFSTSLTIFLALLLRFVLLLYRGELPRMIRNLLLLYEEVTYKRPFKSLRTPILMGCVATAILTVFASIIDGYHLAVDHSKGDNAIHFLFKLEDPDGRYQKWMFGMFMFLAPIKMFFAYGVSVLILIFCCSVYTAAKRILVAFHEHVRRRTDKSLVATSDILSSYLTCYNRICLSVAEIDAVLSPCVLLLYGLMVSGQFYTLTVLISKDTELTSLITVLHNLTVFVLTTAAFLLITLTASKVTEVSEDVKRSLQMLSENAGIGDPAFGGVVGSNIYLILISILSGSHLCFTGWKMFNINKSFILTTAGVMISYGIVIVQIGKKYGT